MQIIEITIDEVRKVQIFNNYNEKSQNDRETYTIDRLLIKYQPTSTHIIHTCSVGERPKVNLQNIGTLYFDILKLSQLILLILLIHLSLPEAKTKQNWVQESSSTAPAEFSSRSVRPFTKKRVQKIYKTEKHQQQRQKSLDFRYFFGLIVA